MTRSTCVRQGPTLAVLFWRGPQTYRSLAALLGTPRQPARSALRALRRKGLAQPVLQVTPGGDAISVTDDPRLRQLWALTPAGRLVARAHPLPPLEGT
jgi:alkylated DNA nucleotide flippase Atl1